RWVKFEEKVEDGGERWSKPHVTALPLHSLLELRTCLRKGTVLLDLDARSLKQIVGFEEKVEDGGERWSKPHVTALPLHSLLELRTCLRKGTVLLDLDARSLNRPAWSLCISDLRDFPCITDAARSGLEPGAEISEAPLPEQLRNRLRKKIPAGAEVSNVLVGEVDFLEGPFIAFIRLQEAVGLGALTEVAFPSRFLFILLGPRAKVKAYHEIGRAVATVLTDELFQRVAYQAQDRDDLIAGVDEFLDELTVLPPGKWDPTVRIAPPKCLPSPHRRYPRLPGRGRPLQTEGPEPTPGPNSAPTLRSGSHQTWCELNRPETSHGVESISKAPWYWSDFSDALSVQCLSAVLYIYLATVTNAITFGGMLGDATDNMQDSRPGLEQSAGANSFGVIPCTRGSWLTPLLPTAPAHPSARDHGLDYLEFRLWIGLWVAFFGLVLVATEASHLVQYFTRFTEEGFCALISFIFIYDAVKKMLGLADSFPVHWDYRIDEVPSASGPVAPPATDQRCPRGPTSPCSASRPVSLQQAPEVANRSLLTRTQCLREGGHLVGTSCNYVPDVTLLSFILFLGTFLCSTSERARQTGPHGDVKTRPTQAAMKLAFPVLTTAVSPQLLESRGAGQGAVATAGGLQPTNPQRGWVVSPFGSNPWWVCLASAVPAVLVIILVFMDQQITAVILNRTRVSLQKGAGFHLDLFCVSLLMILTSVTGLPWYVSATVISLAHMDSLKKESTTSAPGEPPRFLGIRYRALRPAAEPLGVITFHKSFVKYISMPVLYGVFLYMGVAALSSIQ
uniref:Solute carrier family 4 member 9 n=1 Tax=Pelodiscus sinensis TaxID=13735 RepID=K7GAT3_PELSI